MEGNKIDIGANSRHDERCRNNYNVRDTMMP